MSHLNRRIRAIGLSLTVAGVFACSASAAYIPTGTVSGIVGGKSVAPTDPIEKSVVALYQETPEGGSLCTATIIARNFALTAAHCVEEGTQNMVVLFGDDVRTNEGADTDEEENNRATRVVDAVVPPAWDGGSGAEANRDSGDIALIRLERAVPKGYHAAHLASSHEQISQGDELTLAGFGIADARGHTGAGVLRKTKVQVLSPDFSKTEMVLDQSDGSGACHGDSGGPALLLSKGKLDLVGVTSRGYPDSAPDDCRHQVVYTKVSAYRKWITDAMKSARPSK